ncbi:MAG: hypothetical protein ACI9TA_002083 [Reinekea sp.]|jgi:hypothetical protein
MIQEELSPEQITGHLKDIGEPSVSPELYANGPCFGLVIGAISSHFGCLSHK